MSGKPATAGGAVGSEAMSRTPERAARSESVNSCTELPRALTVPHPVTTTRCSVALHSMGALRSGAVVLVSDQAIHTGRKIPERTQVREICGPDPDSEMPLDGKHQVQGGQRIDTDLAQRGGLVELPGTQIERR